MENKIKLLFKKLFILLIVFIWTLMFYVLGWVCGWMIGKKNHSNKDTIFPKTNVVDSLKPTLDSIQYNIIVKDSIIYNIEEEMKNEIKKVQHLDDSTAIIEFYKLVSE